MNVRGKFFIASLFLSAGVLSASGGGGGKASGDMFGMPTLAALVFSTGKFVRIVLANPQRYTGKKIPAYLTVSQELQRVMNPTKDLQRVMNATKDQNCQAGESLLPVASSRTPLKKNLLICLVAAIELQAQILWTNCFHNVQISALLNERGF